MNKKLIVALCVATVAVGAFAKPHGGPRHGHGPAPVHRRVHVPPHAHHHHKHSAWGRGGQNFWPGFVGGIVGGMIVEATAGPSVVHKTVVVQQQPAAVVVHPAPVVVQQTATTERIWVEGCYVDQVQPNGTIVRIWQPGHYETRTVVY